MQMLEFIEELAKKICEIELCVSNLSGLSSGAGQRIRVRQSVIGSPPASKALQ